VTPSTGRCTCTIKTFVLFLYGQFKFFTRSDLLFQRSPVVLLRSQRVGTRGVVLKKRCGDGVPRRIARGNFPPIPKICIKNYGKSSV